MGGADFTQRRTIGPELVGRAHFRVDALAHCFSKEFQRRLLVSHLRHEAFQYLAFMIHGPPQVVPLAVDLHENLVQVPTPAA